MFRNKSAQPKLPGPKDIPDPVKKYLVSTNSIDPDIIPFLKAVQKNSDRDTKTYEIRIFDPSDADARSVSVRDYNTLNENPEIIIAEGSFNESNKQVELSIRRTIPQTRLFKYEEILPQIEGLKEPGSSIFFFVAAGAGVGGPLGRGAAVIKMNDNKSEKKQKKYSVYGASVVNMQPVQNQLKIFDSDKPQEIAKWVAGTQKPRFC